MSASRRMPYEEPLALGGLRPFSVCSAAVRGPQEPRPAEQAEKAETIHVEGLCLVRYPIWPRCSTDVSVTSCPHGGMAALGS
ncbi:hypothetical protein P7K49_037950 [Saguinus oedipus]|uniref:Uncharacterized protein n=1 Tax=Saguinus oedipus TaxID=9490 RepID=A0ABQ9TD95_SAGOE|nr:hypothetical protein P7K49_037950 [Saguinus oedipus]